jgi:hypothetical protein
MLFIPSSTKISLTISAHNIHVRIVTRGKKNNRTHEDVSICPERNAFRTPSNVLLRIPTVSPKSYLIKRNGT